MVVPRFPVPPSANALFVWRDGARRKTGEYSRWRRGAALLARATLPRVPARTPVEVTLTIGVKRHRDIDNITKPTLDMLKTAHVLHDDRWVDRIVIERSAAVADGFMSIEVALF